MVKKIPPDAEAGILERAGKGASLRAICDWLEEVHGVHVTPAAIRKKLAKARTERAEVAKTIVREKLAKTVVTDIDVLDNERRRLRKLAGRLYRRVMAPLPPGLDDLETLQAHAALTATCEMYLKAIDRLTKVIATKLHYAGADTPDDPFVELAAAERSLASGMSGLAARLRAAGVLLPPDPAGTGGT